MYAYLFVCQTIIGVGCFIFAHPVHLQGIWIKSVYEGHRVNVKVTRAKKGRKSLFPQCKTLIANNSGSITHSDAVCVQRGVFGYGGSKDVTAMLVT